MGEALRNLLPAIVLATALSGAVANAQSDSVTFTGEVPEGQEFRRDIGRGLDFVLQPTTAQPDVITGWTLSVAPQHPPKPECSEFSWVVTPPYHFQNQRYLDTSYSTTAQEAMRNSPRSFKFVLNCADYHTEDERVEEVLSPGNHSKEEVDDALAKLGSSPVGEGNLWVEDYRIIPGKRDAAGVDLGRIYWIRFKVEIEYPRAAESRQPE